MEYVLSDFDMMFWKQEGKGIKEYKKHKKREVK
jgi:hypothetical protein